MPLCCCFGRGKKKKTPEEPVEEEEVDDDSGPDYTPWWEKEENKKKEEESEEGYQSAGEIEAAEKRKSMKPSDASEIKQALEEEAEEEIPDGESFTEGLERMAKKLGDTSKFTEAKWQRVMSRYPAIDEDDLPAPGTGMRTLTPEEKRNMRDRALVLCIRARYIVSTLVEDHVNAARNEMLTEEACDLLRSSVEVQSATMPAEDFMKAGITSIDTKDDVSDTDLLESLLRSTIWFQLVLQFQPRNPAALEHWVQRVKDLREEFPYVDLSALHTPPTGYCLVHCAALQNNAAVVQESLAYNCNVNTRTDDTGETALHIVSGMFEPNLDLVKELLRAGANMDLQESQGKTPLFIACDAESTELVQLLLDSNASPATKAHGRTCLDVAKQHCNEKIVRMLERSMKEDVSEDEEVVKERKKAAQEQKKRDRADTFQRHNPMEKQESEDDEEDATESQADYDESGDEDSGSGWSDIGESEKDAEAAAAEEPASDTERKLARLEEERREREEKERREKLREAERKKAEQATESLSPSGLPTPEDVDYKSTDLYKEFAMFKERASSPAL